ncbi:VOC family protein [Streptomyces griseoluteus]
MLTPIGTRTGTDHRRRERPPRPRAPVGRVARLGRGRRDRGDHRDPARAGPDAGAALRPRPRGRGREEPAPPDFRPDDQEPEVARLLSLGARRADPLQDGQHWGTLFDPEGTEFCVLSAPKG